MARTPGSGDPGRRVPSRPAENDPNPDSDPILAKGPESIPLPISLRNQAGTFHVRIKVVVAADGSSIVSILDSTGIPELDESLVNSFSYLAWQPGMHGGKPVQVAIALRIDDNWQVGEDAIHLKQNRPQNY